MVPCLCGCERLEALAGCVKCRVDGGLEAALGLGFSVLDAVKTSDNSAGLRVVIYARTPEKCARAAMTGPGVAGVYVDVGHGVAVARAMMALILSRMIEASSTV